MIKPSEDPKVPAPEPAMPTPSQTDAPEDPAVHTQLDPPKLSVDETTLNPTIPEPSSSANPPTTSDNDVLITGTRFIELGNPTVLAQHSAKQEDLERQKVRFDVSHYAHLNVSDVLSGYLSHVHSNRDSEIEMVKQLQLNYEVHSPAFTSLYMLFQPPSLWIMMNLNDL